MKKLIHSLIITVLVLFMANCEDPVSTNVENSDHVDSSSNIKEADTTYKNVVIKTPADKIDTLIHRIDTSTISDTTIVRSWKKYHRDVSHIEKGNDFDTTYTDIKTIQHDSIKVAENLTIIETTIEQKQQYSQGSYFDITNTLVNDSLIHSDTTLRGSFLESLDTLSDTTARTKTSYSTMYDTVNSSETELLNHHLYSDWEFVHSFTNGEIDSTGGGKALFYNTAICTLHIIRPTSLGGGMGLWASTDDSLAIHTEEGTSQFHYRVLSDTLRITIPGFFPGEPDETWVYKRGITPIDSSGIFETVVGTWKGTFGNGDTVTYTFNSDSSHTIERGGDWSVWDHNHIATGGGSIAPHTYLLQGDSLYNERTGDDYLVLYKEN